MLISVNKSAAVGHMKAWFCQTLSNLPQWFREKKVDYPLIHLVEFEWKGKLLRFKTGIQIIKAKAKDHSYLNSSFLQHRQLFHKWKCDPHGKKTIWFQINGHLEDTKVQVWRPNGSSQSLQFYDFFQTVWRKPSPFWQRFYLWIEQTWHLWIRPWLCPGIRL